MRVPGPGAWLGLLVVVAASVFAACSGSPPRELGELSVIDSVYVEPTSGVPYSGPVVRYFRDEPKKVQLEGELLDGRWEGELTVYHPNGRVRYLGSFAAGQRCGPWTENADSVPTGSVYEELVREVESMGLYPPCEDVR